MMRAVRLPIQGVCDRLGLVKDLDIQGDTVLPELESGSDMFRDKWVPWFSAFR
jgi:hypothetical protein